MSVANSHQVGGAHYAAPYQHWDLIEDASLGYLEGCATKYLVRVKNGVEDVKKALHYVDKLIERSQLGVRVPYGRCEPHLIKYFLSVNNITGKRASVIELLVGDWSHRDLEAARCLIKEIVHEESTPERTADVLPFARPGQDTAAPVPPALEQRTPPPLTTKDGVAAADPTFREDACEWRREAFDVIG